DTFIISYLGYYVRQRAKKCAHRRKSDGCRHRESLSLDWFGICLRVLRPEEGNGDISRCLRGGIVRFPPSIEDVQCLLEGALVRYGKFPF
ncbi:hypothetical protein GOODEAATRI_028463, partial [Goodea atripinnis]